MGVTSAATLLLDDGTTITGGAISIGNSGVLDIGGVHAVGNSDATLDGVTVSNDGNIQIDLQDEGAILTLDGGTTIEHGGLTIDDIVLLDIETGAQNPGATRWTTSR